jgi:hypothetical protein
MTATDQFLERLLDGEPWAPIAREASAAGVDTVRLLAAARHLQIERERRLWQRRRLRGFPVPRVARTAP